MRIGIISENSISAIRIIVKELNNGNSLYVINKNSPIKLILEECKFLLIRKIYVPTGFSYLESLSENFITVNYTSDEFGWMTNELSLKKKYNNSLKEALILSSSGTTNRRKLIILSHKAINLNAKKIFKQYSLNGNDKLCIIKQITHSSTFVGELLIALKYKVKCYLTKQIYNGKQLFNLINKVQPTFICLNPLLLDLLYNYMSKTGQVPVSSLKKIYVSGSSLNYKKEYYYKICNDILILNCYGLTELGPRVTMQDERKERLKCSEGVGYPLKGIRIKIKYLDNKKTGEILVKSKCKMIKYSNNTYLNSEKDWICTGDIGFIDIDGELNVIGRIDEQITINSINFNPVAMENLLINEKCFEDCIIVKQKRDSFDEILCIYQNKNKEIKEIDDILETNFSKEFIPRKYKSVEKIEYNENGKKIRDLRSYGIQ